VVPRFVEEVFAHVAAEEEARAAAGAHPTTLVYDEAGAADARSTLVESSLESVGVTILEVYEGKVFDLLRAAPDSSRADGGPGPPTSSRGAPSPTREYGAVLQLELDLAMSQRADVETRCYWVRREAERVVGSSKAALEALRVSMRLRHTASHALNEASSRSHCIFSLQVCKRDPSPSPSPELSPRTCTHPYL
jgi:hypothetical protein